MKALVVGGGLLGLTTAWFLNERGVEVTVVEKNGEVGVDTSFANGGMLHASQASPWNEPGVMFKALQMIGKEDSPLLIRPSALLKMIPWALAFFKNSSPELFLQNLQKNTQLADYSLSVLNEYFSPLNLRFEQARKGILKIYQTEEEIENAEKIAARGKANNIPYQVLDSDQTIDLEPALKKVRLRIKGGIYFPNDMSGNAYLFCKELSNRCAINGVKFICNSEIQRVNVERKAFHSLVAKDKTYVGDVCVVAAGSYSSYLLKTAGLRLPVQPVKGYSITIPNPGDIITPRVPVIDEHYHAAICPLGDNLRVAGTAEFAGFNKELSVDRIDNLFELVRKVYPEIYESMEKTKVKKWSGLRPMTPDGVGVMGKTRVKGLFINTGHGHLGWTMAPGGGKLVSDIIVNGDAEIDFHSYSLERF
jgi:D-amino-acid dehydrogenase